MSAPGFHGKQPVAQTAIQTFTGLAIIGLILCSEGNTEHIEYLMLEEDSPVKVAQYYTKLPDKKLLSEKLQRAIAIAKEYQRNKEIDNREPPE